MADDIHRLPGFCSCGLEMRRLKPGVDFLICANCDVPQAQEFQGLKRVATDRDWSFEKVWRQRVLKVYGK